MSKVEDATAVVPVMQRDLAAIREDVHAFRLETREDVNEVKDDTRSIRRALYSTALSIVGASIMFTFTVFELFK